ncbi:MAG: hypothetical protein AB199_02980 [Parcubacteria bacterium C7867-004]|nr:MAG: hypothetical protein AB199_02980 [Parcubacteria bacterium C7867-004]
MSAETDFLYYTSAEEAIEELRRRQADPTFCAFIESLFGIEIPPMLLSGPMAIFSRPIASPSYEFCAFYEQAERIGLPAGVFEYTADKFVARNWEKYCLGRLAFTSSEDDQRLTLQRIVDFNRDEGKLLSEITTIAGTPLTDFHHDLLSRYLKGRPIELYDFSDWFIPNRGGDRWSYYLRYLGLFLVHGILFENFLMDKREASFTTEVVMPAFRTLADAAGCAPLIVRAMPAEKEGQSDQWCYYHDSLRTDI